MVVKCGIQVGLLLSILAIGARGQEEVPVSPIDSLCARAEQAYVAGRYSAAVNTLKAIPPDSHTPESAFTLGASYAALNDVEHALQYLRKAATFAPSNLGYRFHLARVLAAAGFSREAVQEYTAISESDSSFVAAWFNLGMLACDRRDYLAAIPMFKRVVDLNPRDFLALYRLGSCYANLDSIETARRYLSASLTLNGKYGPSINQLASLYFRQGDYQAALRLYRVAASEFPDQAENWYNLGLCFRKFEDTRDAVDSFSKAIALDTTNSLYYAHLGQAYFDMRRFDSSALAYESAVRLEDGNPVYHLNLGLAYVRMEAIDSAEQSFKRAIAAHDPAQIARVYDQLGAMYFLRERYKSARDAYASALRFDGSDLEALFYHAVTLDQLKQYKLAQQAYRKYLDAAKHAPPQEEKVKAAKLRLQKLGGRG